jgi:hypothetical protein
VPTKKSYPPKEKIDLFDKLIASVPEIERMGDTVPYSKANGSMFVHMNKSGSVGIRLPKEAQEEFLEKYNTELFETYNTIMKEWVCVPDDLLGRPDELKEYLLQGFEYVKTLKPKPTSKKK